MVAEEKLKMLSHDFDTTKIWKLLKKKIAKYWVCEFIEQVSENSHLDMEGFEARVVENNTSSIWGLVNVPEAFTLIFI